MEDLEELAEQLSKEDTGKWSWLCNAG
jgi:hypothetical protein